MSSRSWLVAVLLVACKLPVNAVECEQDTNCDLGAGGRCFQSGTGNTWCAYPDSTCPAGFRFSEQSVGDGLQGQCVEEGATTDGGVDGMDGNLVDAPIDAPPGANFARSFGATALERGRRVATTSNGIYVIGQMGASVDFGGGAKSGLGFIAKFDEEGQHVWSNGLPVIPRDIALDSFGNPYLVGEFTSALTFGGATLNPQGGYDFYLVKFDGASGAHVMSRPYGGTGNQEARRVAVLPNDDAVICGIYNTTSNLGGSPLSNSGGDDVFVMGASRTNGAHLWSTGFGGTSNELCEGLVASSAGVVALGSFSGNFTFNGVSNTGAGGFDLFVAGHSTSGVPAWHQRYGSAGADLMTDASLTPQGDIVVTGTFGDDFMMGSSMLNNSAAFDVFAARLAIADGTTVWAKSVSGALDEAAGGITVVGDRVVAVGSFAGSAAIGSLSVVSSGSTDFDVFIAQFAYTNGEPIAARRVGGTSGESPGEPGAIADTVVLTGGFQGMSDFVVATLNNPSGMDDIFLARVRP